VIWYRQSNEVVVTSALPTVCEGDLDNVEKEINHDNSNEYRVTRQAQ